MLSIEVLENLLHPYLVVDTRTRDNVGYREFRNESGESVKITEGGGNYRKQLESVARTLGILEETS